MIVTCIYLEPFFDSLVRKNVNRIRLLDSGNGFGPGMHSSSYEMSQQRISREIALSFARELGRWGSTSTSGHKREPDSQQLSETNSTAISNQSSHSDESATEVDRGRDGSNVIVAENQDFATVGSPGFEQSWVGEASEGTDVPRGLAGSSNFILQDIDLIGQDISESWGDFSAPQSQGRPVEASAKFFPFGRDEIVDAKHSVAVPQLVKRPDDQSTSGMFSDVEEPDSEEDALRVVDEYVAEIPPKEVNAEQAGVGNGVADAFPDDIVPQQSVQMQPRNHKEHTDYDLQGRFSDLLVPSSDYDSRLGEDTSPAGLQDAVYRVPEEVHLAAEPSLDVAGLYPAAWGDRYVKSDGEVTLEDGSTSNPGLAAARDWVSSSQALSRWNLGASALKAAAAALEQDGVDLEDVSAPAPEAGDPSPSVPATR